MYEHILTDILLNVELLIIKILKKLRAWQ